MKSIISLFLCLLTVPLFAQSSYPPTFEDARVETYRDLPKDRLYGTEALDLRGVGPQGEEADGFLVELGWIKT